MNIEFSGHTINQENAHTIEKNQSITEELSRKLEVNGLYTVDRFEGSIAVLENRKTRELFQIQRDILPDNIQEGSILAFIDNAFVLNEEETKKVEHRIKEKMDNLWE